MAKVLRGVLVVFVALAFCVPTLAQDQTANEAKVTKKIADKMETTAKLKELKEKEEAANQAAAKIKDTPADAAKAREAAAKAASERHKEALKTAVEMSKSAADRKQSLSDAAKQAALVQAEKAIRTGAMTADETKAIATKTEALAQLDAQLKPEAKLSAVERTQLLQHVTDVLGLVSKAKQEGGLGLTLKKAIKDKIESGEMLGAEAKGLIQKARTVCSIRQALASPQSLSAAEKAKRIAEAWDLLWVVTEEQK